MGLEDNKSLIAQYMQVAWSKGDPILAEQFLADDYIDHHTPPGMASDRVGHRQKVEGFHNAFPDAEFILEALIAEGDKVAVLWNMQAYHLGSFLGVPATGKACKLDGIDIYQVRDGKIVASWHRENLLGLLRQLKEPTS